MSPPSFIPFNLPLIEEPEIEAVTKVLKSGWLTTGPVTAQFESEFCRYVRSRHALAVNSATSGLQLSLAALGIGPGDEVVTTPLTFCATVNSILRFGATPVLADVDGDLNLDPDAVEAAITPKTRALLPVHFAGVPCEMDRLWSIARRHNLAVVEDAAHAVGATFHGEPIGSGASDAVVFSFYATKNMTTGEGGMVVTGSDQLDARMRTLCLHGMSRQAWTRYSARGNWAYEVVDCGFKFNMTDIAAALGLCQLERLESMNLRRREIAETYNRAFRDMPELETPHDGQVGNCWHLYVLRLNLERFAIDRAQFIEELRTRGIGCSVHFIPIPLHPYYQRVLKQSVGCKRALSEYDRMVSLPLYPRLDDKGVHRVIDAVRSVVVQSERKLHYALA